jgi:hypothetical protein
MAYLYHSIIPFEVFIPRSLLMRDAEMLDKEPGQAIGIFSYKGYVPSFKVLLNNGSVWDFCLPTYLRYLNIGRDLTQEDLELPDLVYHNCPSCNFAVYVEPKLGEQPIDVYFKHSQRWSYGAQYLLTVDWWTDNESVNLVKLTNGQIAFVPNHKMLCRVGGPGHKLPTELPKYRAFKDEGKL